MNTFNWQLTMLFKTKFYSVLSLCFPILLRTARFSTTPWWSVWPRRWLMRKEALLRLAADRMRSASTWITSTPLWSSTRASATTRTPSLNPSVPQAFWSSNQHRPLSWRYTSLASSGWWSCGYWCEVYVANWSLRHLLITSPLLFLMFSFPE